MGLRRPATYLREFPSFVDVSNGRSLTYWDYRARQQYETPRSESSTRGSYTSSSKQPTKHRSRRDSESRRPEPISEYATSQPITIRKEPSKKYHDPGGYDEAGEEIYDRSNYSSPSGQRQFDIVTSHASSYHQPTNRDWAQDPTVDSITRGTNTLTIDEVVGSPQYQVASTPQSFPPRGYQDDRGQTQLPSMIDTGPTGHSSSYQAKGKERDQSTYQTPRTQEKRHIYGTKGDTEELDGSYKVRNFDYQKFFRPGRVFSTLWTNPYSGTTNTNDSENNQFMSSVTYVIYKQKVHSKIRRFVVVRQRDRCCLCLPVTTYDGRGYRKKGINLDEHGLIYSSDKKPSSVQGITKAPLKVKLSRGAEKLVNPSYINYGRVYTVETNVKVKDVGDLDTDSRRLLRRYFNEVNIAQDDDSDGTGPPQGPQQRAVELAGLGGGVMPQGYSVAQPSGLTMTSVSMQADYNQPHGYDRSSGGYNQPSIGWANTGSFAPAGQTLYPPAPNYNPQTGVPHLTTTPAIRYSANPVYDMSRTSSSAADYQPTDNRYFQSAADNSEGGHSTSYSGNPPPLYVSTVDTHSSQAPVSATTWSEHASRDHRSYVRQDEYPSDHEQSSSTRIISSDPLYFPAESSRLAVPIDAQSDWSTQVHPPYDDDGIELTGQEEAQATRRHRRESVSTRSGGRSGDSQRESDRYRRKK
jgi:hypothetical protein